MLCTSELRDFQGLCSLAQGLAFYLPRSALASFHFDVSGGRIDRRLDIAIDYAALKS
jgi:hypothetical protein